MYDWEGMFGDLAESKTIVDYKIVRGHPIGVESEVKELLTASWQPIGNMYVLKDHSIDIVVQCMVLYKTI